MANFILLSILSNGGFMKQSILHHASNALFIPPNKEASLHQSRFFGKTSIFLILIFLIASPSLFAQASFSAKTDFAVGGNTYSVSTGDLNGDGKPDMVSANYILSTISVLLNTTAPYGLVPSFSVKTDFATGTNPFSVQIGDVNGDGKPDLVVANNTSTNVSVLLNTTAVGASTPSFSAKTDFPTSLNSYAVSIGDLNGDGKPDLAVGSANLSSVAILLNTTVTGSGTPSFTSPTLFASGGISRSVSISDINGDGMPDLVTANFNNPGTVSVLLNATAPGASVPSFSAKTDFSTGNFPKLVSTNDLNGDGTPDIAVTDYTAATVSVLLNTTPAGGATPSFSAKTDFATGNIPYWVSIGDFDMDSKPDLAVANFNSATVSVLLNTTATGASVPSFLAKADFATGNNPSSVSINDFNGDGKLDLAVSNYASSSVSVLLNTFIPPNIPPIANAGVDTTVEQTSPAGAEITLNGSGSSDADGDTLAFVWTENAAVISTNSVATVTLPAGGHTIILTVNDGKGGVGSDTVVISVVDTTPPAITLNGSDTVEVEQNSSYIELGAIVSDIADPSPTLLISGSVDSSTVGEYSITYTATDASGNQASKVRLVRVVPSPPIPPTIIVKNKPMKLLLPFHQYVRIDVDDIVVRAFDSQNHRIPKNKVTIQSVSSDEPEDVPGLSDGKTKNDIAFGLFYSCGHKHKHKKGDARAVYVRAERQNNGNGRVYTITLEVEDASGAIGTATYEVWVPDDKRDRDVINDGPSYTVYPPESQNFADSDLDKESVINENGAPSVFSLNNNYPNPFNPTTEIQFSVAEEGMTTLTVYDMLGRVVETLVEEQLSAGEYTVTFNAKGLSSGVYIYRLRSGESVMTKRMMLMK